MKRLVFFNYPESIRYHYNLGEEDSKFLMNFLGMYPRESDFPKYSDSKIYYDSFKKIFVYGCATPQITTDSLRLFNVIGRAYGFLSDCAYIVDYDKKIEFLLSAVIYVNEKNCIGCGKYEYEKTGYPFLKDLSLAIYNYEMHRKLKYPPQLNEFRLGESKVK